MKLVGKKVLDPATGVSAQVVEQFRFEPIGPYRLRLAHGGREYHCLRGDIMREVREGRLKILS